MHPPTPDMESRHHPWNPWPTLFGALAVIFFLASQIVAQLQVQTTLRHQVDNLTAISATLDSDILHAQALEAERARLLKRADEVSDSYNQLLGDLLRLAESNSDARAVVAKFQIQLHSPSPPTTAPSRP